MYENLWHSTKYKVNLPPVSVRVLVPTNYLLWAHAYLCACHPMAPGERAKQMNNKRSLAIIQERACPQIFTPGNGRRSVKGEGNFGGRINRSGWGRKHSKTTLVLFLANWEWYIYLFLSIPLNSFLVFSQSSSPMFNQIWCLLPYDCWVFSLNLQGSEHSLVPGGFL